MHLLFSFFLFRKRTTIWNISYLWITHLCWLYLHTNNSSAIHVFIIYVYLWFFGQAVYLVTLTDLSLYIHDASGRPACVSFVWAVCVCVCVYKMERVSWGPSSDGCTLSGWDNRYSHLYKRHESTARRTGRSTKKQPIIQEPDWHRVDRAKRRRLTQPTPKDEHTEDKEGTGWQRAFWPAPPTQLKSIQWYLRIQLDSMTTSV